MFEKHFDAFVELLDSAISLNPNWKAIPPAGKVLFFKAMAHYSLAQVTEAMTAHIRDPKAGMFQPTPAHLIAHIEAKSPGDGRPGVEEAWALCLKAQDEAETVIWTTDMQEAFAICRPALNGRDNTAARMAFKEAYSRIVDEAKRAARPVKWEVSLGHDAQKRELTVQQAVTAGRLPAPTAAALLPNYSTNPAANEACPEGLKRVKEEVAKLQAAWTEAAERRAAEKQAEREAIAAKKAEIAEQVEQYQHGAQA